MGIENSGHSHNLEGSVAPVRTDRRTLLKAASATGAAALTTSLGGCASFGGGDESGNVKVGVLADRSGPSSVYGIPMLNAAKLWRNEVNDSGGLLDRDVELLSPDPQSSNDRYQNHARQLILEEEVDVLIGGITSASREAIRPIVDENQQLYVYPGLYEGGLCDEYTYVTGPVPTQQLRPLVSLMVDEFGGDIYTIAADYNFGQISAHWTREYVEEEGGSIVGEEFVPLSVSNFDSTINRIEREDPDWVLSLLVGANHIQYFEQAESTGLDKPVGSTVQVGGSYEHKTLSPPALEDVYVSWHYMEEVPTERNQQFVNRFKEQFPDTTYVNQNAASQYTAHQLYQKAVERAGTTNMEEVSVEIEKGMTVEAPMGDTSVDPATHHMTFPMWLARVKSDHSVEFLNEGQTREPTWLQGRCNLAEESSWDDPTTEQYTP